MFGRCIVDFFHDLTAISNKPFGTVRIWHTQSMEVEAVFVSWLVYR